MIRSILVTLSLSLGATAVAASDRLIDIPRLKSTAVITAEVVRIGDVIQNAGPLADVAIFRSPDVGTRGSVSSTRILEAVRQHDLLIVDTAGVSTVEIIRDSRVVTARDVEKQLTRLLSGQHGIVDASQLGVAFDREPQTFHVESQTPADFQIVRSQVDARTGRFDVTLGLPGSTIARTLNLRFTGVITEFVEVPILARALNRHDVLGESDITFERRPRRDVSHEIVTSQEKIAGLAARQSLRPGVPLRRSDLIRPELVKRDEFVTIVYQVPGILLTLRGKAMESGALGDLINVINPTSKRIVQGVVTAPGKVTATPTSATQLINTASVAPKRRAIQSE